MKDYLTRLIILLFFILGLTACGESPNNTPNKQPADTYFSLAVTENSHNHTGARLLFLDFQDTTPNPSVIQNNVVISPRVTNGAITLDGDAADWNTSLLTTVNGLVQNNYPLSEFIDATATDIAVGSAWDDDYIYFVVQWQDAGNTQSTQYKKWIFGDQGSGETDWNPKSHIGITAGAPNDTAINSLHTLLAAENEDRVLMMFPMVDTENNFSANGSGCAAYCHTNLSDGSPYQNYTGLGLVAMHTNVAGDTADIWHWKSSRTAPSNRADDKHLVYAVGSANGRSSDSGSSAYSNNALSGINPEFMHTDGLTYTGDVLHLANRTAYSGSAAGGEEIPAVISTTPSSSRADVETRASFSGAPFYRWTVEFRRLRNTGNADDHQFNFGNGLIVPATPAVVSANPTTGAGLYTSLCLGCHAANGSGTPNGAVWTFPRIQRASGSLIHKALSTVGAMQSISVNDQQVEDIAAYLQTQATFVTTQNLAVAINGVTGSNIISSNPAGISCPGTCSFDFVTGSDITLNANYINGYTFSWSDAGCSDNQSCVVTLSSDQTVTATYTANATTYTLNVTNGGNGTVSSSPGGIACGGDCTELYTVGVNVSLTAIPDTGYQLASWGGDCTGTGSCSVSMNANRNVTATFELIPASAQPCTVSGTPPAIPDISMQQVVTGLSSPVHVTNAGDNSGRLFVVEQRGTIRVVQGGSLVAGNFLDIRDRVRFSGEMGLLSVAFHPDFASNNKFYVNYVSGSSETVNQCSSGSRCTIISEFTLGVTPAVEDSERIILEITQPDTNHNGGQIAFGPEQPNPYLYIGMGDGGGSGDTYGNGQDLTTLLGAMLRIDINTGSSYLIPADNPLWTGVSGARREIWSYGLRNPWRFSFDPLNGDLYAGDVGQDAVEEIDVIGKEMNYGWNPVEGDICYIGGCTISDYEAPIITHTHSGEGWYSITGGMVYRGSTIPDLCGVYLYGDYVAETIRGLRYDGAGSTSEDRTLTSVSGLVSFGYDENYEVYALSMWGTLYKVISP